MANLHELVPPDLAAPSPAPDDTIVAIFAFVKDIWSTEVEYVEKRVVVEVVDGCASASVCGSVAAAELGLSRTKTNIEGKRTSDVRMDGSAHPGRRFQQSGQRWR